MLVDLAREVMSKETDLTQATTKALETLRKDLKEVCAGDV